MRRVSMPLKDYQDDLAKARSEGAREGFRRLIEAWKQHQLEDDPEAVCIFVEEFEDDQPALERALKAVGLWEAAKRIWNEKPADQLESKEA